MQPEDYIAAIPAMLRIKQERPESCVMELRAAILEAFPAAEPMMVTVIAGLIESHARWGDPSYPIEKDLKRWIYETWAQLNPG